MDQSVHILDDMILIRKRFVTIFLIQMKNSNLNGNIYT